MLGENTRQCNNSRTSKTVSFLVSLHLYRKDKIISSLAKKDIHLNISYPWPIHIMDAYKHFVCAACSCLKKTEEVSNRIFSLPMYPTLTDKEQDIVIEELKKLI